MTKYKYVLSILAVVFSVAAIFAFRTKGEQKEGVASTNPVKLKVHATDECFIWVLNNPTDDPQDPANYHKVTSIPEDCDNEHERVCAILAPELVDENNIPQDQPDIDAVPGLATDIVNLSPSSNLLVKSF